MLSSRKARKARSMGWCQGGLVAASSAPKQRPAEVSMSTIAMDKPGVSMNLALGAITIYVALLAVALRTGEFELLQLPERLAAGMSAVILLTASVIRILVTLLRPTPKTRVGNVILVVHMISFSAHALLASFPCPTLIDSFTGCRVNLVRWCEWTVLAFTMSFIIEAIDSPSVAPPLAFGLTMGSSTLCGLILPYLAGNYQWLVVMGISLVLYLDLFRRVWVKFSIKREQPAGWPNGGTPLEKESYRRFSCSRGLMLSASIMWTLFVLDYFGAWLANITDPCKQMALSIGEEEVFCQPASWPFVLDCIVDVTAKMCYAIVLSDIHESLPALLEKDLSAWFVAQMAVVWANSCDVLVISTRTGAHGTVSTTASNSLAIMLGDTASNDGKAYRHTVDFDKDDDSTDVDEDCSEHEFFLHMIATAWRDSSSMEAKRRELKGDEDDSTGDVDGRSTGGPTVFMRQYSRLTRRQPGTSGAWLGWELHASVMPDSSALVIVIRDISDRISRHDAEKALLRGTAEKRLIAETVSRQKDEEANRFMRHEIKNGLLAVVGCFAGLHELHAQGVKEGHVVSGDFSSAFDTSISELNGMLQRTLDTVLAQAMAREVVHGTYAPRPEPTNLRELLGHGDGLPVKLFTIVCEPLSFPLLDIDPRLVTHIHRNAVSNAYKYGQSGGDVKTVLKYENELLSIKVVNNAGHEHERLTLLKDPSIVFEKGERLHQGDAVSSGDGAWIMARCADALGGHCTIRFDTWGTVFELQCPVAIHVGDDVVRNFAFPRNVRAIGIDDLAVQRVVMKSLFNMLGIPSEAQLLLGGTPKEIDMLYKILAVEIEAHPDCPFLVLADENLDVDNGLRTVSGSEHLEKLRLHLSPEAEARTLLLVRSANDSDSDRRMYASRAHGVLNKEPLVQEGVLRAIVPLWLRRFRNTETDDSSSSKNSTLADNPLLSLVAVRDALATEVTELLRKLEATDDGGEWKRKWRLLHMVKGNLQSMPIGGPRDVINSAIACIEQLRGVTEEPVDWDEQLDNLRLMLYDVVGLPLPKRLAPGDELNDLKGRSPVMVVRTNIRGQSPCPSAQRSGVASRFSGTGLPQSVPHVASGYVKRESILHMSPLRGSEHEHKE